MTEPGAQLHKVATCRDKRRRVSVSQLVERRRPTLAVQPRAFPRSPQSSAGHVAVIERTTRARREDKIVLAAAQLAEARGLAPDNLLLAVSNAEALLERREVSEAERIAMQLSDRRVFDPAVVALRARCRLAAGDSHGAVELFTDIERRWPGSHPARIGLSLAHFEADQGREAHAELVAMVRDSPEDLVAKTLLASMLVAQHQKDGDANPGDSNQLDLATELSHEIRADEPRNTAALRSLAAVASHRERLTQAEAYLREAAYLRPNDRATHNDACALYLKLHCYDEARASVNLALRRDARDARSHFLEGSLLRAQGDLGGAAACYRRAVALVPYDALVNDALARVLLEADRYEDALALTQAAFSRVDRRRQVDLRLTRARTLCAFAEGAEGDRRDVLLGEAMEEVDKAELIADSKPDGSRLARIEHHKGVVLYTRGAVLRAKRAIEKAHRAAPEDADIRRNLLTIREESPSEQAERFTRKAGQFLCVSAGILFLATVAAGYVESLHDPDAFKTRYFPAMIALFVAFVVGAILPRMASFKGPGVHIKVASATPSPAPARTSLDFGDTPLLMMSGPTPYQLAEPTYDSSGDAAEGE